MLVFTAYMIYRYIFTGNPVNIFLILFQFFSALLAVSRHLISGYEGIEYYTVMIFLSTVLPMIILFYDAMNGLTPCKKNKYKYHRYYSKEIGIDVNEISKPFPARVSKVSIKSGAGQGFIKTAYEALCARQYDKAMYIYQSLIENGLREPASIYNLAWVFYQRTQYADALSLFIRSAVMTKRKHGNKKIGIRIIKNAYYNAGNCLFKMGKYHKAAQYYSKSTMYGNDKTAAAENIIISKIAAGDLQDAYSDHTDLLKGFENRAFSHNLHIFMGRAYEQKQQYQEALLAYKKAKEIRRNQDIMHHIAKLLYNICRFDEAVNEYKEIIKLYPENKKAFLGLGLSLYKLRDLQGARDSFASNLDMDEAKYNYLLISYKLSEFSKVLPVISALIMNEQTDREYRLCAAIYMKLGRYYDAADMYKAAILYRPDDHRSYYGAGLAYSYQKDLFTAAGYYSNALKKAQDNVLYASVLLKTYIDSGMTGKAYDVYIKYDDVFGADKTWRHLTTLI